MSAIPEVTFLTPHEIARLLRVSSMTTYRLIRTGVIPAHRVGRSFRIDPRDFADFMRGNYAVEEDD
jgi:excisionase family DNA binding protein